MNFADILQLLRLLPAGWQGWLPQVAKIAAYLPTILALIKSVEAPGNGEAKLRKVLDFLAANTPLIPSELWRKRIAGIVSAIVALLNAFDMWGDVVVVPQPAGVYTWPLHSNSNPVPIDPYKQRWANNPVNDADAKALYAPNDLVLPLVLAPDAGKWLVVPHGGVGPGIPGDPQPVSLMDGTLFPNAQYEVARPLPGPDDAGLKIAPYFYAVGDWYAEDATQWVVYKNGTGINSQTWPNNHRQIA